MNNKLVAALFLAQRAVMAVDIPANALGNIVAAATTTDPGLLACATAFDVISYCASAIPDFTAAPEATQAACLCCYSTTELDPVYSSCANYIEDNYPGSSTEYSLNSVVATFCAGEGDICGGAGGGATPTGGGGGAGTTATSGGDDSTPPACTSLANIVVSCSQANPGFSTLAPEEIASCICYDGAGASPTFTTAFDDYAASCASWAKTADPTDYSDFHGLEGFCADNVPRTGGSGPSITRTADSSPTQTGGGDVVGPPGGGSSSRGGFGGFGGGGGGSSETGEATPRRTTTVVDTPTGLPNLAPGGVAGGPVAWAAGLLSLVMSLFFLA